MPLAPLQSSFQRRKGPDRQNRAPSAQRGSRATSGWLDTGRALHLLQREQYRQKVRDQQPISDNAHHRAHHRRRQWGSDHDFAQRNSGSDPHCRNGRHCICGHCAMPCPRQVVGQEKVPPAHVQLALAAHLSIAKCRLPCPPVSAAARWSLVTACLALRKGLVSGVWCQAQQARRRRRANTFSARCPRMAPELGR